MSRYVEKVKGMPRAVQWAGAAAVLCVVYFVLVEPVLGVINKYSSSADTNQEILRSFSDSNGQQNRNIQILQTGQSHFGDVAFVGDEKRRVEFNIAVDEILKKNNVVNRTNRIKPSPMTQGALTRAMGTGFKVERVMSDIDFDATPEKVAAVVAALEQCPLVATVSRVVLRRVDGKDKSERLIHATITAETWVATKKG